MLCFHNGCVIIKKRNKNTQGRAGYVNRIVARTMYFLLGVLA